MKSLREAARRAGATGPIISVRALAQAKNMRPPISVGALIKKLLETPPPAPTIRVTSEGTGGSSVFVVTGSGFLAGRQVTIRVVDNAGNTVGPFQQSADANGNLNFRQSIPCNSGLALHFSATDSRPNPHDLTGVLFSNTVHTTCP
jgi:hypothetical protein